MGLLLAIVARFLLYILSGPALVYGTISTLIKGNCNAYWFEVAISIDRLGNAICGPLFNDIMIEKDGYKFGNGKETLSSVYGKDERDDKLKPLGEVIVKTLDVLDKDHAKESIDNTVK
jgi:hypothetical protein